MSAHTELAGSGCPRRGPGIVRRCGIVAVACGLLAAGCSRSGPPVRPVHGSVTCGGESPDRGRLRFVPVEGTPGPAGLGHIVDGEYRIEARGGVPVGKHRVEVTALKRTGRKVTMIEDGEEMTVDETVHLESEQYAGRDSPLVVEVTADSDGRIDIEIPAR